MTSSNHASVLVEPSTIRFEDRPRRQPAPGEALLRIKSSGICGTDLKIYKGAIPVDYPRIMGHEMAGEVVELGEEVTDVSIGDRVLVNPVVSCGACRWCRIGLDNVCPHGALYGRDVDGGFGTFMTMPTSSLFRLPGSIGWDEAPVIQVLTTVVRAHQKCDISPSDRVLVIGLGVSGQFHVQMAKARGAHVIGTTRSAWKLELAERLGCDVTCTPDRLSDVVREFTDGEGVDVVIDAAGTPDTLRTAVSHVRISGTVVEFGILTGESLEMPLYDLYFKEITIVHPRASRAIDFRTSIDLVASGTVRVSELVTEKLALDDLEKGLHHTMQGTALKVVLEHK